MVWVRLLETEPGSDLLLAELASEARVSGLLVYKDERIIVGPSTMQPSPDGLFKYHIAIQTADAQVLEVPKGTRSGYVFVPGPVGEIAALLSLALEARFYVMSTEYGGPSGRRSASKKEFYHRRGRWGPLVDPIIFSENRRNFCHGPTDVFDQVLRVKAKHHQSVITAAHHYTRGLHEVGIDDEMVLVRLVSAVEALSRNEPAGDSLDGISMRDIVKPGCLSESQLEEFEQTFDVRKSTNRFTAFLARHGPSFLEGQPAGPSHTQVTLENLSVVAKAVYAARSRYLHNGDPMYMSYEIPPHEWHMDTSAGMQLDNRKWKGKEKLPKNSFLHQFLRHCIMSEIGLLADAG